MHIFGKVYPNNIVFDVAKLKALDYASASWKRVLVLSDADGRMMVRYARVAWNGDERWTFASLDVGATMRYLLGVYRRVSRDVVVDDWERLCVEWKAAGVEDEVEVITISKASLNRDRDAL